MVGFRGPTFPASPPSTPPASLSFTFLGGLGLRILVSVSWLVEWCSVSAFGIMLIYVSCAG
jgi:hypothetical protein